MLGLLMGASPMAQKTVPKSSPPHAIAKFRDGNSQLVVVILQPELELVTKYGKLTIPLADIRDIEFGFRCPPDLEKDIYLSIHNLGSDNLQKREGAQKHLQKMGYYAYPFVKKATKSSDLERVKRAVAIKKILEEKVPKELLALKEYDVVRTKEVTICGHLDHTEIKAHCEYTGDLTLKLATLTYLDCNIANQEHKVDLDPATFGNTPDQWFESTVLIRPNTRLKVTAEGTVDLWPQGMGQYIVTPKGYSQVGRDSPFMAGALIGRVGQKGKAFLIGENYDNVFLEEGRLFLSIVLSPWNNVSMGKYQIKATTSYVAR